jgi:hypothetical protein
MNKNINWNLALKLISKIVKVLKSEYLGKKKKEKST